MTCERPVNICGKRGDAIPITVNSLYSRITNQYYDLTGSTITLTVKALYTDSSAVYTSTLTTFTMPNGGFEFIIPHATTKTMLGEYVYDIKYKPVASGPVTLFFGEINIEYDVGQTVGD